MKWFIFVASMIMGLFSSSEQTKSETVSSIAEYVKVKQVFYCSSVVQVFAIMFAFKHDNQEGINEAIKYFLYSPDISNRVPCQEVRNDTNIETYFEELTLNINGELTLISPGYGCMNDDCSETGYTISFTVFSDDPRIQ